VPVELSSRYLDALGLLVSEAGRLVTKERFLDEVWRGVPVTDEALTQCIRALRRALGDDATDPRFIETVPKHGYRFIAPLGRQPVRVSSARIGRRDLLLLTIAGAIGGGLAGLAGGVVYGLIASGAPSSAPVGGASILLVITCICTALGLIGAAGVSAGMMIAERVAGSAGAAARIVGGGLGGLAVGIAGKLVLLDGLRLLVGDAPAGITGGLEGLVLGLAIGAGLWGAEQQRSLTRGAALAALAGLAAGLLLALLGRPLMAASLALLTATFPGAHLSVDAFGAVAGEGRFGPVSRALTACLEGALFAGAVVTAIRLAAREIRGPRR
jgi:hypothetical protein